MGKVTQVRKSKTEQTSGKQAEIINKIQINKLNSKTDKSEFINKLKS